MLEQSSFRPRQFEPVPGHGAHTSPLESQKSDAQSNPPFALQLSPLTKQPWPAMHVVGDIVGDFDGTNVGTVGAGEGYALGDVLGRLVGQAWSLHDEVSPPAHALPPQLGAGLLHERVHVPPPHAAGHGDPHALHAPCTVGQ